MLFILIILLLPTYQTYGEDEFEKTIELLQKGNNHEREYAAEFLGKLKTKGTIPFLRDAMTKDNNWLVRLAAVSSLNKLGESYDVEVVEKSLRSGNKDVRLKAAQVLQGLSEWNNKEIILNLFEDKDTDVRRNIIIAAGKLKLKEAVQPLILMLKDPISDTRESAAASLGNLGDGRALKPLLEMLDDSSSKVVRAAVIALGEIGDEEITMSMIRMLGHKDKSVRYFAVNVLGELGGKTGFKAILGMVKDKEVKVRLGALAVSGRLKIKEYIPVFKEVLVEDTDPYVRLKAARNLALMEDYTGYDLIRNEVFNKNTDLKREAIETLGMIKDRSSVATIKEMFLSPNPDIKEIVIWSLGEIGGADALEFLLKKLEVEKGTKADIIDALRKFPDERVIHHLNNYLDDEDFVVRRHAADALSNFTSDNPGIEKKLVGLLSDVHFEVRQAALTTLVKWNKRIDSKLLDIARDNSDPLQIAATVGLTELNNKEAVPIMKSLCQEEMPIRYRLLLAYELASFGDYSGKDLVIEMAKSEDYVLRKQAAEYSSKFIDSDVFVILSNLISDNKKDVKLAAAKSLGQMFDMQAVDILLNNLVVENLYLETEIENSLIRLKDISVDSLINVFKGGGKKDSVYVERVSSILVKIGPSVIDKLIKAYEGQDVNLRIYMMGILAKIGKDSLRPLVNYWDGEFGESNNVLVDAMIKLSIESPNVLVDLLEDETLQNKVVKLIARLTPDKVLSLLIAKLYVSSGMMRIKVIECLRGMSVAASDKLIEDLSKSDDSRKLIIIEALGEMRAEKAIVPLGKIAAETQNVKVKDMANQVVANIKQILAASGKSRLDKLKKKRGKITMIEKNFIFTDLGWQDNINVGAIFQIFDSSDKVVSKLEITEVVGNKSSIGKMLNDTKVDIGYVLEEEVKEVAVATSGTSGINEQLNLLKDKNPNVRKSATWAVGEIEYKSISKIYQDSGDKKSLNDSEQEMLNKVTNIFIELFSDVDNDVCLAAVRGVTKLVPLREAFGLKNDFILDPLCNLLNSSNNYVQRAAVETLAELKDPKAIPFLINVWNDDDATVRGNVAWALEKIGKPAVPSLKEALKDASDEKKRAAAGVLYKLGYKIKRSGNNYEVLE